jgi:SAM-dependent methyltransferase
MTPSAIDYLRYSWQMLQGKRSLMEQDASEVRRQDIVPYLDLSKPRRILDIANGRLRPQYAILRADGHQVYGIDMINRPSKSRIDAAYKLARWMYLWKLGLPHQSAGPQALVCGHVGFLPFPDAYFDLATSIAAFEHFLDVPAVVAELHRVLRPGGVVWVSVHLFTSPSGGHNITFSEVPLRTVPRGVEPWDHLRKRRLGFTVPLNRWRRDQYLETFARHFEIVKHYCHTREGEHLLTAQIEAELAEYGRDELTTAAYVIVARKPASVE